MIKTRTWILIFAGVLVSCCILTYILWKDHGNKKDINISLDGKIIYRIDLNEVKDPYTIKIDAEDGGYNIVYVEHGRITVTDADCPDRICVHQGDILPIVCMPHKLVIEYIDEPYDGVSR